MPADELLLIPTKIKPTCAIEEKARNRLILFCLIAKRLPMIMVMIDKINMRVYQVWCIGWKTLYKTVMKINAIAPFETTERKEVTATGAPW